MPPSGSWVKSEICDFLNLLFLCTDLLQPQPALGCFCRAKCKYQMQLCACLVNIFDLRDSNQLLKICVVFSGLVPGLAGSAAA